MRNSLTVAVSARSLFDLEEYNEIYRTEGLEAFLEHLSEHKEEPLPEGPAFPLVKALIDLNARYSEPVVKVITVSSIHPKAGLRVLQSIAHHNLDIKRTSFTGGADIIPYLKAYDVDLFLSRSEDDTQRAINNRIAAALMYDRPKNSHIGTDGKIRIAFDGDAVVFDASSEKIYQANGLAAFAENERRNAHVPLPEGPFGNVFRWIQEIQSEFDPVDKPFYIGLITARGGLAQERVLRTFEARGAEVDEVHFLSGHPKDRILEAFNPHIYFDDQHIHVDPASKFVPAARVPYLDEDNPMKKSA